MISRNHWLSINYSFNLFLCRVMCIVRYCLIVCVGLPKCSLHKFQSCPLCHQRVCLVYCVVHKYFKEVFLWGYDVCDRYLNAYCSNWQMVRPIIANFVDMWLLRRCRTQKFIKHCVCYKSSHWPKFLARLGHICLNQQPYT